MKTNSIKPIQALNKAFRKVKLNRNEFDVFKSNLIELLDGVNEKESEEFHKKLIADFFNKTYYGDRHFINTKKEKDFVIHNGKDAKSSVGVILEAKKPTAKGEMLKVDKLNVKALQQLVLYFLRERIVEKNLEVKHLIVTNVYEWFIFDSKLFEKFFVENKELVKQFNDFEEGRLSSKNTSDFYKEIAAPAIEQIEDDLSFTYLDIRESEEILRSSNPESDRDLIPLFKIFSPEHLLKLPFANDSNTLDKGFYSELLHIIGLEETSKGGQKGGQKGGKKLIQRQKEGDRSLGSLIENAIGQLESSDKISRLNKPEQFGENDGERLFNVALELALTWINRILFLKLLEAQLIGYHKSDKSFSFLNLDKIQSYNDLNSLFFDVLAKKPGERNPRVKDAFAKVPYLNSSLFEATELERQTIVISNLGNESLPLFGSTVLKDRNGKKRTGEINGLEYLFEFLDAYDFSSEGSEDIQEENKTLINASVLGLIFEKINGYKDGSFFTPGFITMYMSRETIRRAVVQKFNKVKGWNCQTIDDLYDKIEDKLEANAIINSLKICDPAVGSGHFLVSVLNEIIATKSELKILLDRAGKTLRDYRVVVENDELIVTDDDGKFFEYYPNNGEKQRVQEALFHEKKTVIENCFFGVDINPNSVKICRLRLWIELLKNAYYKDYQNKGNYGELETLPNIDINIKCGNSLIGRFALDNDLMLTSGKNKRVIKDYKMAVQNYRRVEDKKEKREIVKLIEEIKGNFRTTLQGIDPNKTKLRQLEGEVFNLENQLSLFEESEKEKKGREKKIAKLNKEIDKLKVEIEEIESARVFDNAFEWRFEFPEALNDGGDFVGFDVVIGNPPYGVKFSNSEKEFYKKYYSPVHIRTPESFNYFVYRFKEIAASKALYSLIIPSSFLNQIEFAKTRELILKECGVFLNINLGDGVFQDVTAPTCIVGFSNNQSHNLMLYSDLSKTARNNLGTKLEKINNLIHQSKISSNQSYSFIYKPHHELIKKCYLDYPTLKDVAENVSTGISPGLADAFILQLNEAEEKNLEKSAVKKLVIGGEINRYFLQPQSGKCIIYFSSQLNLNDYPNITKHLRLYKEKLENRAETKKGMIPYYVMLRPRREQLFIEPKILIRQTANRIIAAYDEDKWYCLKSAIIVQLPGEAEISYPYLLALFNSQLTNFLYKDLVNEDVRVFPEVKPVQLFKLPIAIGTKQQQTRIETTANKVIAAKKSNPNADTTSLEKKIDRLIYQLYQLTEEEIKIVEENV
jgi:hypothetical protein